MRVSRTALTAVAVVLAAMAPLAGCSGDDGDGPDNTGTDAATLVARAKERMRDAGTLRLTGTGTDEEGVPMTMDMCVTAGENLTGTIREGDRTVEMIKVDGFVYIMAPDGFWTDLGEDSMDPATAARAAGKYIRVPAGADEDSFWHVRDPEALFGGSAEGVVRGEPVIVDGDRLVPLTREADGGGTTTVYVPARGEPYITRVRTENGREVSDLRIRRTGKECSPAVPDATRVLDADELGN